ncbi:MAG: A/G-specific adenine glycosylase [Sulfuricella sp.]
MRDFASRLIEWQKHHGRHGLPWQQSRDPYAVWLSEIMLQQTQVGSVIPYYQKFMLRFPDIAALAAAPLDDVLAHWSGLGYYARGRNLHRAAQAIMAQHGGIFPDEFEAVVALPGIGRSTAAAILAFAFGQRRAILDGNVKRVLARCFGIAGYPGAKAVENRLWQKAESLLPDSGIGIYTQALMDLGATVCSRKPVCADCPVAAACVAHNQGTVAELPTPRPRKPVPQKEIAMMILLHRGEVFLEKRPPVGIWGGMWSFPEAEVADEDYLHRFCMEGKAGMPLPEMQHTFTHCRLRIVPRVFELTAAPAAMREPGGAWISPHDALQVAVPKPVRDLLKGLIR